MLFDRVRISITSYPVTVIQLTNRTIQKIEIEFKSSYLIFN